MVRQTRNIAEGKEHLATQEEKDQAYAYHHNTDSLYHEGINVGKEGFYDPNAGADKHPIRRPEAVPTPVLATDPGQPKGIGADLVSRERNKAVDRSERALSGSSATVDKSERGVVRSTGRKAKPEESASDTESTSESRS